MRCCIPEDKVDLKYLIDLLIQEKRNNPSRYSLVILSEGAEWQGYKLKEYGEADAFGQHKKMSVPEDRAMRSSGQAGKRLLSAI